MSKRLPVDDQPVEEEQPKKRTRLEGPDLGQSRHFWSPAERKALQDIITERGWTKLQLRQSTVHDALMHQMNRHFNHGEKHPDHFTAEQIRSCLRPVYETSSSTRHKPPFQLSDEASPTQAERIQKGKKKQSAREAIDLAKAGLEQGFRDDFEVQGGQKEMVLREDDFDFSPSIGVSVEGLERLVEDNLPAVIGLLKSRQSLEEGLLENPSMADLEVKNASSLLDSSAPGVGVHEARVTTGTGQKAVIALAFLPDTETKVFQRYYDNPRTNLREYYLQFRTRKLPPLPSEWEESFPSENVERPERHTFTELPNETEVVQITSLYKVKAPVNLPAQIVIVYGKSYWFILIPIPDLRAGAGPLPQRLVPKPPTLPSPSELRRGKFIFDAGAEALQKLAEAVAEESQVGSV